MSSILDVLIIKKLVFDLQSANLGYFGHLSKICPFFVLDKKKIRQTALAFNIRPLS